LKMTTTLQRVGSFLGHSFVPTHPQADSAGGCALGFESGIAILMY
jgi:hypothetical protein